MLKFSEGQNKVKNGSNFAEDIFDWMSLSEIPIYSYDKLRSNSDLPSMCIIKEDVYVPALKAFSNRTNSKAKADGCLYKDGKVVHRFEFRVNNNAGTTDEKLPAAYDKYSLTTVPAPATIICGGAGTDTALVRYFSNRAEDMNNAVVENFMKFIPSKVKIITVNELCDNFIEIINKTGYKLSAEIIENLQNGNSFFLEPHYVLEI